ncbi:protein of unknown function [Pararobbsia alpina]
MSFNLIGILGIDVLRLSRLMRLNRFKTTAQRPPQQAGIPSVPIVQGVPCACAIPVRGAIIPA